MAPAGITLSLAFFVAFVKYIFPYCFWGVSEQ